MDHFPAGARATDPTQNADDGWLPFEDARIVDMRNNEGAFWVAIARALQRRPVTPIQVRQRYEILMQRRLTGVVVRSGVRPCLKCEREFHSRDLKRMKICASCREANEKIGDACMDVGMGVGGYSLNEGCRGTLNRPFAAS